MVEALIVAVVVLFLLVVGLAIALFGRKPEIQTLFEAEYVDRPVPSEETARAVARTIALELMDTTTIVIDGCVYYLRRESDHDSYTAFHVARWELVDGEIQLIWLDTLWKIYGPFGGQYIETHVGTLYPLTGHSVEGGHTYTVTVEWKGYRRQRVREADGADAALLY